MELELEVVLECARPKHEALLMPATSSCTHTKADPSGSTWTPLCTGKTVKRQLPC